MRGCNGCLWEDICIGNPEIDCDDFTPVDNEYDVETEYELGIRARQDDYEEVIHEFD